jgi:putative hydroxymethylpyrimidine transport system ATP-binding protein
VLTVELRQVSLCYADTPLFENLNLTLEGGRWTCLLGQSGVGKTSLLRFIAGLLPAVSISGEIHCSDGQALAGRVGYMAQQDLLLPWLTVLQNVMLGSRLRGETDSRQTHACSLLAQVGLGGHEQQLPQTLSGGMRQRVALARTLYENRPLMLLDEPFSSLDAITRFRLQTLAAELLHERICTTLLITHDPLEALRLGHRIYVLAGQPAQLLEPLEPAGEPPRDLQNPELLTQHGRLLAKLAGDD